MKDRKPLTGRLILASESLARRAMLEAAGLAFEAMPARLDEAAIKEEMAAAPVEQVALQLAERKAATISARQPDAFVVGSDSILVLPENMLPGDGDTLRGDIWLEKPGTMEGLRAQLLQLRGRAHQLVSAAAVVQAGRTLWRHADAARLVVRDFSDAWLADYLAQDGKMLLSSVGGYHLEARGVQLFEAIEGDQFVVRGLPLLALLGYLRGAGVVLA